LSATLPMDFGSLQAVAKYAFGDKSGKGYSVPQRIILPENRTARKPSNVLLIINETLRADFIGYQTLANPIPPASRMTDAIASDSLSFVFKRARSNSSSTRVSLPAILMGMIPTTATSADYHRMPTLWNVSKALGYRTFFVTPQNWDWQNLDVFFLNKQVDQSITAKDIGPPYVNNAGVEDHRILDYTHSIFQEFKKNKNPFFGVIQFNCTHQPYNPGDPHTALSPNSTERYAAAVRYLDSLIAQIYIQLNEAGLKDETLIIVTSDHGENFKHRGLARLNNLYDEVIRIPLWVSYPRKYYQTPEGKARFHAWKQNEYSAVQNADIFPTLLSYWGVDKTSLQGYSYQGMRWEDPADSLRILSGTNTGDIRKWNREEFFLLRHHVKFLATDKAGPQIYNLQSDPYEEHNLWDDLSFREAHRPWIHQYISDHAVLAELAKRMKINLGNGAAIHPSDTSFSRADIDLK
ncbi:MAG TPA: sulfatase-like hydrolase/transferase, partial [bacterium]|nr:sulfatase-like hydrolase/transferase [bacterium]